MKRHFYKENIQMTNEYMKKCSRSLVIREVEIKMQYPITAVKKVIIKKTSNNKCR